MNVTKGIRSPELMKRFLNTMLLFSLLFGLLLAATHAATAQSSPNVQNINEPVIINTSNTLWEGETNINQDGLVVIDTGKSLTVVGIVNNNAGISTYEDSGITARYIAFINKGTLNFNDQGTTKDQSYIYIGYNFTSGANNEHRIVQTMSGATTNFINTRIDLNGSFGTLLGQPLIWALPNATINFSNVEMEQSGNFTGPYFRAGNEGQAGGTINFIGSRSDPYDRYDNRFKGLNSTAGIRNNGTFNIESGVTAFINSTINLNQQDAGTWIIKDGATLVFDNTTVISKKASSAGAVFQVKKGGTLEFTNNAKLNLSNIGNNVAIKVEAGGRLILTDADIIGGSAANIVIENSLNDVTINTTWNDDYDSKNRRLSPDDYLGQLNLTIGGTEYNLGALKSGAVSMNLVNGIEIDDATYEITVKGSGAPAGLTKCTLQSSTPVTNLRVNEFDWYKNTVSGSAADGFTVTNTLKMVTVDMGNTEFTYDGTPHKPEVSSIKDLEGNDLTEQLINNLIFTYKKETGGTPTTTAPTDAGLYTISAALPEMYPDLYIVDAIYDYLEIHPASFAEKENDLFYLPEGKGTKISSNQFELTFNNNEQELITGGIWKGTEHGQFTYYASPTQSYDYTAVFSPTIPTKKAVGTYYVYWRIKSTDPNYIDKDSSPYIQVKIVKADIANAVINITSSAPVADGTQKTVQFYVTYNGTTLIRGTDYTVQNNSDKGTNAGTYTLTINGTGNYKGTKTAQWTILAPTFTPTATKTPLPTATQRPTNTPLPTFTPTATNTPQPTATQRPTNTPLPTFTPTATNTQQPTATQRPTNTSVPTSTPTATVPVNVSVTITLSGMTNVYDGKEHTPVIQSLRDASGRDYRSTLSSDISFSYTKDGVSVSAPVDAGNYEVTVTLNKENYTLTNPGPHALVINQAPIPTSSYIEPQPESLTTLPYDPAGQDLVKENSGIFTGTEYGTFYYLVEFTPAAKTVPAGYTPERPSGRDAGTYLVYWYLESNNPNYADRSGSFTVRIALGKVEDIEVSFDGAEGIVDPEHFRLTYKDTPLTGEDYELTVEESGENTWTVTIRGRGNFENRTVRYILTYDEESGEYTLVREEPEDLSWHMEFYPIEGLWDRDVNCPTFGCGRELPATGFPTRINAPLSIRPQGLNYKDLSMRLQIPTLDLDTELIGVPENGSSWAVEWIGNKAGVLSGTALPGEGYSLIAGHNHLDAYQTGPFLALGSLNTGDKIFVNRANGSMISFTVYANELLAPNDMQKMAQIAEGKANSLVLVTCENEAADGGYLNRRVIFAAPQ